MKLIEKSECRCLGPQNAFSQNVHFLGRGLSLDLKLALPGNSKLPHVPPPAVLPPASPPCTTGAA